MMSRTLTTTAWGLPCRSYLTALSSSRSRSRRAELTQPPIAAPPRTTSLRRVELPAHAGPVCRLHTGVCVQAVQSALDPLGHVPEARCAVPTANLEADAVCREPQALV